MGLNCLVDDLLRDPNYKKIASQLAANYKTESSVVILKVYMLTAKNFMCK